MRLRLAIFRSNKYIYAQIIDDTLGKTLVSASDFELRKKEPKVQKNKIEWAKLTGQELARKAKIAKIKKVFFDRDRYKYHGRVRSLAEGAREELEF